METAEIKRRWLEFFGDTRPHRRAVEQPAAPTTPTCCSSRRHGAVQALLPGPGDTAVQARHQRAEVRAHPRHRGGRQDHPARHVLPDERQLLLRRLLQGTRHRARLGAVHPARRPTAASASPSPSCWPPSTRTTTRRSGSGARSPACPTTASSGWARRTTTGTWACPAPAARAARSSSTAVRSSARTVTSRRRATATSSSGTSSSCSTSSAPCAAKDDFDIIGDLPTKNIDTGMGLERVAFLLQGVDNIYEIDEVRPVLDRAAEPRGQALRRLARGRRAPAGRRRPRTQRADADQRRRHPRQRGPRLRPAPADPPRRALDAPARRRRPGVPRAAAGQPRRDGAVLPRAGDRLRAHLVAGLRRGGGVPPHAARRHHHPRHGGARDQEPGRHGDQWRPCVPAARHLRLPDRPDPRDGRRAGPRRSTRPASAA